MIRLFPIRLLQSLGLAPVAYLFVCLMTAGMSGEALSLTLPDVSQPDGNSIFDLLLFSLPGQLLFLLVGCFIHRQRLLSSVFMLFAALIALLQCLLFSQAFGNTWSTAEIFGLLGFNLHWLLLALVPGLAWLIGLERLRG
ncbi:hypothetical protein [Pseudomonas rubra]|uniref:Uncharacterized protein n=1 Tax=Pseudomonas rubra TaxID=2942627 RepID=A0ABT5PGL7_9PSED|nr:hypothetical protein [Pseudomonas rubra]MDD1017297.1 hypothetical protein [Pseudomonas rubra]MDD1041509.1 hypothetical protein [Pseudomonas rubra]MDD1154781.1 hypothetical protein [Pseudomonas rubra]